MRRAISFAALLASLVAVSQLADSPALFAGDPATASDDEAARADEVAHLAELVGQLDGLQAATLLEQRALPWQPLDYDPLEARDLALLQGSEFALSPEALEQLGRHGFVIDASQRAWSRVGTLEDLYRNDLPLFISADLILFTVQYSYDAMLASIEKNALVPELEALLSGMRERLAAGALGPEAPPTLQQDLDLYLAVALSLLRDEAVAPVAGGDAARIAELVELANEASGKSELELFGVQREVDASHFTPRGHYTDSDTLEQYFRASMWLGRVDLRLLETQPTGELVLRRRQVDAALAMTLLLDDEGAARWRTLDRTLTTLIGESDNLGPEGARALLAELGVATVGELAAVDDATMRETLLGNGYGTQRIASRGLKSLRRSSGGEPLPRDRSFLLLGQRFAIDSQVLHNVVFDRTELKRPLPSSLDVAYAALGNDAALALLEPELTTWQYAAQLEGTRRLVNEHPPEYWQSSLYTLWLASLRALSPSRDALAAPSRVGLPSIVATDAWQRRVLNTQLASWAELRHHTVLYVKQPEGDGGACSFPDVYVEPSPAFFAALESWALLGKSHLASLEVLHERQRERIAVYFDTLLATATRLRSMAERQLAGEPVRHEDLAWVNTMVRRYEHGEGCGPVTTYGYDTPGWYRELFYGEASRDPLVADVFTAADGHVLHVATGNAELMVLTVDGDEGPRLFVGLVSTFYEEITEGLERLDDEAWGERLRDAHPVAWLDPVRSDAPRKPLTERASIPACGYTVEEEECYRCYEHEYQYGGGDDDDDDEEGDDGKVADGDRFCGQLLERHVDAVECHDASVDDLSPLAGRHAATRIDLSGTKVEDLAPLADLAEDVKDLSLRGTRVSDLAPLASFTALETLDLGKTAPGDLAPLVGLRSLRRLDLEGAAIDAAAIEALLAQRPDLVISWPDGIEFCGARVSTAASHVVCHEPELVDLAPLAALTALTSLDLSLSGVTDLTPLGGLESLERLDLTRSRVEDLGPLASLPRLRHLVLGQTPVRDLAPLASMPALEELALDDLFVSDLAPLAGLSTLRQLSLAHTRVRDLAPLAGLSKLEALVLHAAPVSDLAPLTGLRSLERLSLAYTAVTGLAPLESLPQLTELQLTGLPVRDLSALRSLPRLVRLSLRETGVEDIAILAELESLEDVALGWTQVTDLSPLHGLKRLRRVELHGGDRERRRAFQAAMPDVEVVH